MKQRILKWASTWPGIVIGVITLFAAFRPHVYAIADIELASAHRADLADADSLRQSNQSAMLDSIATMRAAQGELLQLIVDTRQFAACTAWGVAGERCASFRIPGDR